MKLFYIIKVLFCFFNVGKSKNMVKNNKRNFPIATLVKSAFYCTKFVTNTFHSFHIQYALYLLQNLSKIQLLNKFKIYDIRSGQIKSVFNDPEIYRQTYYVERKMSSPYLSHELESLWAKNITGKGVAIGMISNGFDIDHPDLRENYNKDLSYNFCTKTKAINSSNKNYLVGCAGLMSAAANNNLCGVGAAPLSKFSILQIMDDFNTSSNELEIANALSYKTNLIHIFNLPWVTYAYKDLSITMTKEEILALEKGYRSGRNGLGSIYIIPSGVRSYQGENCAFSSYPQQPETFVIGSIERDGSIPNMSEKCTAIIAATINSFSLLSKDLLYTTSANNECKNIACEKCAPTSIASGIVALLLSYNPNLTARQTMILMIETSTQYDTSSVINAAGYAYSTAFGFGMLNAAKMIQVSSMLTIKEISEQHICTTYLFKMKINIPKDSHRTVYIYTTGCVRPKTCVTHLEQVYLIFTVTVKIRNSVSMYLISPSGTRFKIIEPRFFDKISKGFYHWSLKILGFYGETPRGIWRLQLFSKKFPCWLQNVQLKLYGICKDPKSNEIFLKKRKKLIWGNSHMDMSHSFIEMLIPHIRESSNNYGIDFESRARYFGDPEKKLL